MKIKEQTKKLAAGCSKHCFEVVDKTDEVSHIYNPSLFDGFGIFLNIKYKIKKGRACVLI